jgi:NADPH:quinone reductase-like Zn-dependent oxidoreductase
VKAARIHSFVPPDVVVVEDVPVPALGLGEVLVRVIAAGVAPWDALPVVWLATWCLAVMSAAVPYRWVIGLLAIGLWELTW